MSELIMYFVRGSCLHLNFCLEMVLSAQSYRILENNQISMLSLMQTMDVWLVKFQKEENKTLQGCMGDSEWVALESVD